ncbi:MAG: flagellar export chaperone FliS [Myxococcales bacterium]|nr:flagellar export chaperone FliS [Myxococcales bacterium]
MKANPDRAYASNKFDGMSPERIVLALFDGALVSMERATVAIKDDDQKILGEQLSRAIAIIGELQASLDKERGAEISERLDALYSYVIQGLLEANVKKDGSRVEEMHGHISTVRAGWAGMVEQVSKEKRHVEAESAPSGYV